MGAYAAKIPFLLVCKSLSVCRWFTLSCRGWRRCVTHVLCHVVLNPCPCVVWVTCACVRVCVWLPFFISVSACETSNKGLANGVQKKFPAFFHPFCLTSWHIAAHRSPTPVITFVSTSPSHRGGACATCFVFVSLSLRICASWKWGCSVASLLSQIDAPSHSSPPTSRDVQGARCQGDLMDAAIVQLRRCLEELLAYYPYVLRNVFEAESSPLAEPELSPQPLHDSSALADVLEGFLTELTRVLSIGLSNDDLGLWSVLELLECVPDRIQAVAEASTTKTAAPGRHRAREPLQLQRFCFASQLVYVVRTAFPTTAPVVRARILLRLTLNQGCLLAALELLRKWCWSELLVFYGTRDRGCSNDATSSTSPMALLLQSDTDSDLWNCFIAAIAPVAGPPVAEIMTGAPRVAAHPFQLQLLIPGLDNSSTASHAYYTQVENYAHGRQPVRPSALECYRAALRQQSSPVRNADSSFRAVSPGKGAASSPQLGLHPTEQLVLRVESLPVDRRTAQPKGAASMSRGNVSYDSSSTLSSRPMTRGSLSSVDRKRLPGAKKRRRRHPSLSTIKSATYDEDTAQFPTSAAPTGRVNSNTDNAAETVLRTSRVVAEVRECQDAPEAVEKAAPPYKEEDAFQEDDLQVVPRADETVASDAPSRALDAPSADAHAAAPHRLSPAPQRATELPHRTPDSLSPSASSPELSNLRHHLWLCWSAVVTHAAWEERMRIAMHDVDANLS
ncbi:hypothetical protein, conserved [Leishmania tarentolae]|uniref:Uncharacterized protein n=1 Tax=Leishmania tarentolae TaxID=5689 RepID=A0A640KMV4_LEITA|nr:hypothetical protein, conserved [Leishmania tarentolae]